MQEAQATSDHPNIVVVVADQMRAHAMGAMGNPQVITPNLDELAAEGILITNAISGQPVCTPFRAQLMTGRLFLSYGPPHNPYELVPQQYVDMYEGSLAGRPNVPTDNQETLRLYYAAITSIDANIGRLSNALAEAGVAENTIFVFTAAHGDMLGSQGHRLKQRPWEESINIPFILRYPEKIGPGQEHDWLVTTVDMMPTVLGLSHITVPDAVEGLDLSALFEGIATEQRQAAFLFNVHHGGGPGTDWRGIRTREWIYARHHAGDWVMYDLKNDPYELHNLINDGSYAAMKRVLQQQLTELRLSLGEWIPLVGIDPDPVVLPGVATERGLLGSTPRSRIEEAESSDNKSR